MLSRWSKANHILWRFWQGLREWCGDSAYEKYQRHAARTAQAQLQSPTQFYLEQLNKKYSRPNRCC